MIIIISGQLSFLPSAGREMCRIAYEHTEGRPIVANWNGGTSASCKPLVHIIIC